ncbi:MAG: phage portal protein [Lachnospiraceae bacterium]|nr:phage portal protein [Lachnospiraceae bacterium]
MWKPFRKRAENEETGYFPEINSTLLEALFNPDYMTVDKAMNIPAFAGCVNHICSTAALIPIRLYEKKGDDTEEQPDDERIKLINDDTGDTLSGTDFKKAMMYDYLTGKGGYAYINRAGTHVRSLHYVEESKISFFESVDPIFKDYDITVNGKRYFPYEFIKFIRNSKNGYSGKSIVKENSTLLAVVYNTLLFENKNVKKGGTKRGFLQSEHKLEQSAVDALKESFRALYANDSDGIPVLNAGVKFQEASMTSLEMQLNENKKQNSTEICKIFCMPPSILSGGATAQDWISYIQYCILPKLNDLCTAYNRDLLTEEEKKTKFFAPDTTEYTRADIKTRFEAWAAGLKSGFVQVDEVRKRENLPAINFPYLKLGLQDVLYDPKTGNIYTPNTGIKGSIKGNISGEPESDKDSADPPAPQGQEENLNPKEDGTNGADAGKEKKTQ